jgi:signal transduction histidine kinase
MSETAVELNAKKIQFIDPANFLPSKQELAAIEWRLTFDGMTFPIIVEGGNKKISRINRAACQLLGKDFPDILQTSIAEISEDELWKAVSATASEARRCKSAQRKQITHSTTQKTWDIFAEWFVVPEFAEDWIVLTLYDVTEKVALQESVRRNAVMSAMGALVAGVAHEVRNPLFGISAILDAMEMHFKDDETYNKFNGILRKELGRLTSLMSELLEYGKPPSVELAKEQIAPVVKKALYTTHSLAEKHKVRINCEIDENLPPIMLESSRLLQVFQNLLENALQHSPTDQTVYFTVKSRKINQRRYIECVIRDEGKGFNVEDLPKIFDPFFTRRRGGTGLGLSIVQRIVEEHHGEITAENHPSGGAVITFRLPAV